ncbi:hypothetical protein [Nocardia salmonicida]|uniref:hypothetical protein n=1 Tax=Nocardia salmonicida TaxID=53431 RepID=UPI0037873612
MTSTRHRTDPERAPVRPGRASTSIGRRRAADPEESSVGCLFARAPCHFHRVCGGWVLDDESVCRTCRDEFGPLLRRLPPAARDPVEAPDSQPQPPALVTVDQAENEPQRRNQTCWMCEQRRACVQVASGWECRDCRRIT